MGKKKSKLSQNEKLTLIISSIALILSLLQLIFSIPIFSNLVYHPDIIGKLDKKEYKNGILKFTYVIKNQGNKTAENLALNLTCFKKDNVTVLPTLNFDIKHIDNGVPLKDIIIKSESFVPGDYLFVIIETDSIEYQKKEFKNIIPFLGQIRYKDGFGRSH